MNDGSRIDGRPRRHPNFEWRILPIRAQCVGGRNARRE